MNAAEAGAIELEEPDWQERFSEYFVYSALPTKELCEEYAFEHTFKDYRRFHFTWLPDGKRQPMPATQAMIHLSRLRIFPPRSRVRDEPRTNQLYEPDLGDEHMWLTISQRAWRIEAVESRTLFLESFGDKMQIDIKRAKWPAYVDKCVEALRAAWG